jgi:hypothetical protein
LYVPVHLILPASHGGSHHEVAELLQLRRRLDLERKARGPLSHAIALSHAEEAGESAPECAKGSLTNTLVGVVDKLQELGDGLLEVREVLTASVSDDVAEDLGGDLLLHGNSGDALEVIPVIIIDHGVVQVLEVIIVILASGHDLDLLALNDNLLTNKLAGVFTELDVGACLVLSKALVETLDSAGKVLGKALLVNLGHCRPEDVAGLTEAGVVEVEGFLRGLHQRQDVGLERLRANGRCHLAHGVACDTTEIELVLAILDADIGRQLVHGLLEERQESLLSGVGNRANSPNSSALDLEVLVVEELAEAGHQFRNVPASILGVKALDQRVDGVASTTNDRQGTLVISAGGVLNSEIEVLDHGRDELSMLLANVLSQVIGQACDTVEGGSANLELRIFEKVVDHGQDLVKLSSDEVGGALNAHTQSKNTCLAVVGVLGGEVVAQVLE